MLIKLITNAEQLLQFEASWNEVAGDRPFFRSEWMFSWLQQQVDPVTPAVLVGMENDRPIGIAPLCIESKSLTRKLRLMGSGTVCSDYLGLFTVAGKQRQFAESVADWLSENLRPRGPMGIVDVVELEGIDATEENMAYFRQLLSAAGFRSHAIELEGCWAVDLPESWDAMNASLSKSLRRKTKKAVQRLADVKTEILSSDDHPFDALWTPFVELHQKRRQMLGQDGCFAHSNFESFLRDATKKLVAQGRAELVVVNYDSAPLACCLLLNDGHTNFMYQSGMEPENLSLEPGYQLAVLGLQISIRKGLQRFDFLRGDEPYKARWKTTRIPMVRARYVPRNFASQLKFECWKTGYSLKQWYRPSPSFVAAAEE